MATKAKHKRAEVLAIANQKGGVGKTTTAVTLAAALARMDKKVMLIDLDPHACASIHLRVYPDQQEFSVYDLFARPRSEWERVWANARVPRGTVNIDVVPSSIHLSDLEADLSEREGKGVILKNALAMVQGEYDYIVLDCPPHLSILLVNALIACDLLIIPIQTDFLALHGLKLLFDTVNLLNRVLPEPVNYMALPTMYDRRTRASQRVLDLMRKKMSATMFKTVIGVDTRFREASAQGRVIYELGGSSRGGREYEEVAKEIVAL